MAATAPRKSQIEKHGLRYVAPDELTIMRRRFGRGYVFFKQDGSRIEDAATIRRLKSLAVPPAYVDVRYAEAPNAHIQAIGRDAAGRLQYRYHLEWEKLREARKAKRLRRLVAALPNIRRAITRQLNNSAGPTRELALAAIIRLVERSAIRAGSEEHYKQNKTRGAATLLKSDVTVNGRCVTLKFRGKGGKDVAKTIAAPRLVAAFRTLMALRGRRLFQYLEGEEVRSIRSQDVNGHLRQIAGTKISLKDFRTLVASNAALEILANIEPAPSARLRRKQVQEAISTAAEELVNTPAIARRSYVNAAILDAFESGALHKMAGERKAARGHEPLLAKVIAAASAREPAPVKQALEKSLSAISDKGANRGQSAKRARSSSAGEAEKALTDRE